MEVEREATTSCESLESSESPPWKQFTPATVDVSLCMARTWNCGRGGQCRSKQLSDGSELCKQHGRQLQKVKYLPHGRVDGPIPPAKLDEFLRESTISRARVEQTGCIRTPSPRKREMNEQDSNSEKQGYGRGKRCRKQAVNPDQLENYVACDSCGTWHAVSAVVFDTYQGDAVFNCSYMSKACSKPREKDNLEQPTLGAQKPVQKSMLHPVREYFEQFPNVLDAARKMNEIVTIADDEDDAHGQATAV